MIQTFVFLDLETTGLIQQNQMPKITELSMVAVTRSGILEEGEYLPRVLQKLTLPIHPNMSIPSKVESMTGLSTKNLKHIKPFKYGIYELVETFINRLTHPVCIIAHNGTAFDFPIFLWELECINKAIDQSILSIDTRDLFKQFFSENVEYKEPVVEKDTVKYCMPVTQEDLKILNDNFDDALFSAIDSVIIDNPNQNPINNTNHDCSQTCSFNNANKTVLSTGENFTKFDTADNLSCTPPKHCDPLIMQKMNEKTPESQIIKFECKKGCNGKENAKKKLDFFHKKPLNFKLDTIYKHMFNVAPKNAHSAEEDCLTMLQCVMKIGTYFVHWADCNAVPLIMHKRK